MTGKTKTRKGKQDKAETRQRAANTTAQSRHTVMARGWMVDDGGRSFAAEAVRDDWPGEAARG